MKPPELLPDHTLSLPVIEGFPVYFTPDEQARAEMLKYGEIKERAMGGLPKREAFTDEKAFARARNRMLDEIQEFAENVYFKPIGAWLRSHRDRAPLHENGVYSDDHGALVTLDFRTEEGRDLFLAEYHPKWTKTRPRMWFDAAKVVEEEDQEE